MNKKIIKNKYFIFILSLINRHKWHQFWGLIFTLVYSFLVFLGPIISQKLLDIALPSGSSEQVNSILAVFAMIFLLQPIMLYIQNNIFIKISEDIALEMRKESYDFILEKNLNFFHDNTKGEIMSRLLNDTRMISDFVANIFTIVFKNFLLVISIIIGMFYISWYITLIILTILIIFIFIITFFSKKLRLISMERQISYDELSSHINDTLNNIIAIKVYNIKQKLCELYFKQLSSNKTFNLKMRNTSNLFSILMEAITIICIIVIYSIGFNNVTTNKISVGEVVALVLYFQMLINPLMLLLNSNINLQTIFPIIDRLEEYKEINIKPTFASIDVNNTNELGNGQIKIEDMDFSYIKDKPIFENYNLTIDCKTFVCIKGVSGVGKTTLALLLLGLEKPERGTITIDDISIHDMPNNNHILLVPQNCQLFHTSIINNIRCGDENISDNKIYEVCKRLNIYNDILQLSEGFNTVISDQINISGGQAQRILIARAVVRKPKVIIFDEPTSALDSNNRTNIITLLKEIAEQCTIIAITHDEELIAAANKVVEMPNKIKSSYTYI